MENLPVEILCFIFKDYLTVSDILKCKLVCKKWNAATSNVKLESLIIDERFPPLFSHWFEDYLKRVELTKKCPLKKNLLTQNIFSNIKKLLISSTVLSVENANCINNFKKLEILVLHSVTFSDKNVFKFNLPSLIDFQLEAKKFSKNYKGKIILNTPNLQTLKINFFLKLDDYLVRLSRPRNYENIIEIEHPSSVESLTTNQFSTKFVQQFKNLKYLYCGDQFDPAMFLKLKELQEFHFNHKEDVFLDIKKRYVNRGCDFKPLKLYWVGLDFSDEKRRKSIEYRYMSFSTDLHFPTGVLELAKETFKPLILVNRLCYDTLENIFHAKIPDTFPSKLVDLEIITVGSKIEYPDQCLKFLSKCRPLKEISFENAGFQNQKFFDELPKVQPYLNELKINHSGLRDFFNLRAHELYSKSINFNFLAEFKCLTEFETKMQLEIDDLEKILKAHENKWLKRLEFDIKIKCSTVIKEHDQYIFINNNNTKWKFYSIENLISWIKENFK